MPRTVKAGGRSKQAEMEAQVGMPLDQYFHEALERGLDQKEMSIELAVSRGTVCNYLRRCGFRAQVTIEYVEDQIPAGAR